VDNIDLYSASASSSNLIAKVQGLVKGNYKVKLEAKGTKSASSSGYKFGFDKAKVYPSVEYSFNGPSIRLIGWKWDNCGKMDVSIDGGSTERIDPYITGFSGSSPITGLIKEYKFGAPGNHRITIEATGDKNASSTGINIALDKFEALPYFTGSFTGTSTD